MTQEEFNYLTRFQPIWKQEYERQKQDKKLEKQKQEVEKKKVGVSR